MTNDDHKPAVITRRELLRAGAGLAALSGLMPAIAAGAACSNGEEERWVRVAMAIEGPSPLCEYFRDVGVPHYGGQVWADVDVVGGRWSLCSRDSDMYRWPTANAWIGRDQDPPDAWDTHAIFKRTPLAPAEWQWGERCGVIHTTDLTGQQIIFPRYVKKTIGRDPMVDKRPGDVRDALLDLWVDVDLITGAYQECEREDPFLYSVVAADPWLASESFPPVAGAVTAGWHGA